MLVDHLIYAVPELTAAVADLDDRFGVRAQAGGRHIGLGTHNALLALGPRTYLEIIAADPGQAEARSHGYDPGEIGDGQRVGPSGVVLRWRATGSALAGALVPFLICWGDTEHPASSAPRGLSLMSLQIEHPDPRSLAPVLAALGADIEVTSAAVPALVAQLSGPTGSKVLR